MCRRVSTPDTLLSATSRTFTGMEVSGTKPRSSTGSLTLCLLSNQEIPSLLGPMSHTGILPPLELSIFDGNPSSSPSPGRQRLLSKRARPESPSSEKIRNNKTKLDELPNDERVTVDTAPPKLPNVNDGVQPASSNPEPPQPDESTNSYLNVPNPTSQAEDINSLNC